MDDTATDKSKRGTENEQKQKIQLALSEGEIMSLLYRGVPQSVVQQVRSNTAAVYYRVPEPVEMEFAGRDDAGEGDTVSDHEDEDVKSEFKCCLNRATCCSICIIAYRSQLRQ